MTCHINEQIADHANADNQAEAIADFNESAMFNLFIDEIANFSNGEIELWQVTDKAFNEHNELIKELTQRIATYDLNAQTELRQLLQSIAFEINESMANSH